MGKKEIYEGELAPLLQRYFEKGDETRLLEYLTVRSNLPGPRANLELLGAFGDLFSERSREKPASYWELRNEFGLLDKWAPQLLTRIFTNLPSPVEGERDRGEERVHDRYGFGED